MTEFSNEEKLHHYMNIEMNMQTWNLLGEKDRTEQDDTRRSGSTQYNIHHNHYIKNIQGTISIHICQVKLIISKLNIF